MGQNIVEPEQSGLGPLAVSELAKEFRRLAAEWKRLSMNANGDALPALYLERSMTFEQAAQMLEERLNG